MKANRADSDDSVGAQSAKARKARKNDANGKPPSSSGKGEEHQPRQRPPADLDRSGEAADATSAPVRADKIEHAREIIISGGYGRPEVMETIIDRIISTMRENWR